MKLRLIWLPTPSVILIHSACLATIAEAGSITWVDQLTIYTYLPSCAKLAIDNVIRTENYGCGYSTSTDCFCLTSSTAMANTISSLAMANCNGNPTDVSSATACFASYCAGAIGTMAAAAAGGSSSAQNPITPSQAVISLSTSTLLVGMSNSVLETLAFSSTTNSASLFPTPSLSQLSTVTASTFSTVTASLSSILTSASLPNSTTPFSTSTSSSPTTATASSSANKDNGLNTGSIVGIVIGGISAFCGLATLPKLLSSYRAWRATRNKQQVQGGHQHLLAQIGGIPDHNPHGNGRPVPHPAPGRTGPTLNHIYIVN